MHGHSHIDKTRVAAISVIASASMAALKLVVGIAIGSLALISEALHSSVDMVATIITWLVVRVSDKPADDEHHYGHGKLESLSALGVVAMLYALAGGIGVQAISHLRDGTAPSSIGIIPFVVLLIDIAINFWRARALHRTARATQSQALAADALHFASDVLGSFAVLVGLGLAAYGYPWGDAAAALGIAIVVALLGLKLTRETVQTLLDAAPRGAAEKAQKALQAITGVMAIERLRLRRVGPTLFVDVTAHVPRTLPIDRIDEIKRDAEHKLRDALGDADVTFTAVPMAASDESIRERVMLIARNAGAAIHHVTVHDIGGRLSLGLDLEIDGTTTLQRAHDVAHALEGRIRDEFGASTEVDTHIEPLEPDLSHGEDAPPIRVVEITDALSRFAAETAIGDVHDVRVRRSDDGEVVNFHCRAAPDLSVAAVHHDVDQIERALRAAFPDIRRVISHAEPPRPGDATQKIRN